MTRFVQTVVAAGVVLWGGVAAAQWQVVDMPDRAQAAVVALPDGRILAIGGTDGAETLATTLVYDGAWSDGPPLLTARRGGAA